MPGISTLSRYIGMRFLDAIFGIFALCTVLIFMIDFVEFLRQAGKYGSVPAWLLVWITILRLPAYTEILLPFAVLVGAIAALLMLSRKSELAVMRAGGMSAWQFLGPGLVVAFLLGVVSVTVYNPLACGGRGEAERIFADAFGRETTSCAPGDGHLAAPGRSRRPIGHQRRRRVQAEATLLRAVIAFIYDRRGHFTERVDANEAELEDGYWA